MKRRASAILDYEAALVSAGLIRQRQRAKPEPAPAPRKYYYTPKDRETELRAPIQFEPSDNNQATDAAIVKRNAELIKQGEPMEQPHSLYHKGLRFRLALLADYRASTRHRRFCSWSMATAADTWQIDDNGELVLIYRIEAFADFERLLKVIQDNPGVAGVLNKLGESEWQLHAYDTFLRALTTLHYTDGFELSMDDQGLFIRITWDAFLTERTSRALAAAFTHYHGRGYRYPWLFKLTDESIKPVIRDLYLANFIIPPGEVLPKDYQVTIEALGKRKLTEMEQDEQKAKARHVAMQNIFGRPKETK